MGVAPDAKPIAQGPGVGTPILYLFYEPSLSLCFHEQDIKLKFGGLAFPRVQSNSVSRKKDRKLLNLLDDLWDGISL